MEKVPARALRELGIEGGVEVDFVDPSGAAWQGGIREGDILLRINREHVAAPDSYRRAVSGVPRGSMASVLLLREGAQMYVAFRVR